MLDIKNATQQKNTYYAKLAAFGDFLNGHMIVLFKFTSFFNNLK